MLGCRVASSPSDEENRCLWDFSTSPAIECASICDGCCRVFDGRTRSLFKSTEANDTGCDTDRVPLGSTVLAGALKVHCSQVLVFLARRQRAASGRAPGWNCSRCTGRERVGVEVCVVCPERTWLHSTRLHDMTAPVMPRHRGT